MAAQTSLSGDPLHPHLEDGAWRDEARKEGTSQLEGGSLSRWLNGALEPAAAAEGQTLELFLVCMFHPHSSLRSLQISPAPSLHLAGAWVFQKVPCWGALGTTLPSRHSANLATEIKRCRGGRLAVANAEAEKTISRYQGLGSQSGPRHHGRRPVPGPRGLRPGPRSGHSHL